MMAVSNESIHDLEMPPEYLQVSQRRRARTRRDWQHLEGLGLRGIDRAVLVPNERAVRGMIKALLHIVTVEEVYSTDELEVRMKELFCREAREIGLTVRMEALSVELQKRGRSYSCQIPDLGFHSVAPTRREAARKAARKLWEEAAQMLSTLAHKLTPAQRRRKGRILALVDVEASGLLRNVAEFSWVVGRLDQDSSSVITIDADARKFQLVQSAKVPGNKDVVLARVKNDRTGRPIGPVVEVKPLRDVEDETP